MKIYQVSYLSHSEGSHGFSFHSSMKEAKKRLSEFKQKTKSDFNDQSEVRCLRFPATKRGVLQVLNIYASHNDNG